MIKNRLLKNKKRLKTWVKQQGLEAYRLYERDIPEYPFVVDCYGPYLLVHDRREEEKDFTAEKSQHFQDLLDSLKEIFPESIDKIIIKERKSQGRFDKYQKLDNQSKEIVIQENNFKFLVNLWDYLDSGIFLDHRPLRKIIHQESKAKKVLNLFSYTCSISVAAALGGGTVTSVDLSQKYLDWGKRNFELNQIDPNNHQFIRSDILESLKEAPVDFYDLIILDPPTFSNSKKMEENLDIVHDHPSLIYDCLKRLTPKGTLYFSCNKRKFKLDSRLTSDSSLSIDDITHSTIPMDFRDQKIHVCFKINKSNL